VRRKLIGEFLAELAENPELLAEYGRDQKGFLRERSGLTDEQQDILCSNDLKRIRDAVRDEYQSAEILMVPFPVQHVA
jgi:hypothetical protein